jgi:hypothetical protein
LQLFNSWLLGFSAVTKRKAGALLRPPVKICLWRKVGKAAGALLVQIVVRLIETGKEQVAAQCYAPFFPVVRQRGSCYMGGSPKGIIIAERINPVGEFVVYIVQRIESIFRNINLPAIFKTQPPASPKLLRIIYFGSIRFK